MTDITVPFLLSFLAGISTVVGGLIFLAVKDFRKGFLSFFLGISAGAMIYLSFMELIPLAIENLGLELANGVFFLGIVFIGLIDYLVPHHYSLHCQRNGKKFDRLAVTGVMVTAAIAIHNFPEGVAVFMSSYENIKFGLLIAFATALHNIPEGVAVATPVYYATGRKSKVFWYTFLAGVAEPIGALLTYFILQPYLTPWLISGIFAFVAGIMVYISLDELLPSCFENCQGHTAISGIMLGMLLMAVSVLFW